MLYAVGAAGDGLAGHLSARLDEGRMLIKPRPVSWWALAPDELIVMDFHGRRVDTPSETIAGHLGSLALGEQGLTSAEVQRAWRQLLAVFQPETTAV